MKSHVSLEQLMYWGVKVILTHKKLVVKNFRVTIYFQNSSSYEFQFTVHFLLHLIFHVYVWKLLLISWIFFVLKMYRFSLFHSLSVNCIIVSTNYHDYRDTQNSTTFILDRYIKSDMKYVNHNSYLRNFISNQKVSQKVNQKWGESTS